MKLSSMSAYCTYVSECCGEAYASVLVCMRAAGGLHASRAAGHVGIGLDLCSPFCSVLRSAAGFNNRGEG
jgi:hypothetical protein